MDETKLRMPIDREKRARAFAKLESMRRHEEFAATPAERLRSLADLLELADRFAASRPPDAEAKLAAASRARLLAWRARR